MPGLLKGLMVLYQSYTTAERSHLPHIRLAQGLDKLHVAIHIARRVVAAVPEHPTLQALM